jgi:hypothetical protein
LDEGENPNTSPTRYIMVIDPTDNETAVGLLFAHKLCDPVETSICYVGDFSDDANDLVRSEAVLKVKTAMELGQTVILVNSGPIHSCFYDVFNRHFTLLSIGQDEENNHAKRAGKGAQQIITELNEGNEYLPPPFSPPSLSPFLPPFSFFDREIQMQK